jgi:restriction endonuclease S subunit
MKATDAYRRINNSPIKGIILFYTEQLKKEFGSVKIKDVISNIQTGKTPPKSNSKYYASNDINWFKPSDIGYGKYLVDAKEKFSNIALKEKKGTLYPANTLLIIGIGGGVGRVSILKESGSSNQQITGITFKENINPEYAYYYFLVREQYIKSIAKSMSFPIINQEKLKGIDFSFPEIKEQEEFVRFVDECLYCFENSKEPNFTKFLVDDNLKKYAVQQFKIIKEFDILSIENKKQNQLLIQLRQSIIQEAIQGKFTQEWRNQNHKLESPSELLKRLQLEKLKLVNEKINKNEKIHKHITTYDSPFDIPESWLWTILDECVLFKNGKAHEQYIDPRGNYILINSKFVSTNGIVKKHTNELLLPMSKNDIARVMSDVPGGRALSRCFLIDEDSKYSLNQRIGGLTHLNGVSPEYLKIVLDRNKYFLDFNDGKKQTNLTKNEILSCPVPLPPFEEQCLIVAKVEGFITKCEMLKNEITNLNNHSNNLLKALFNETFEVEV